MMRREQGFTLIEVLIAIAITAIVGTIAAVGLDSAIKAVERQEQQQRAMNDMNVLFSIMSKDFRQATPRPIVDEFGDTQHAMVGEDDSFKTLMFTRTGWLNPRPNQVFRSHLQRVEYRLEDEKLYRRSWYALDRFSDEHHVDVVLVEGVKEFKFRFLQSYQQLSQLGQSVSGNIGNTNSFGGEWRDSWPYPPTGAGSAPIAYLPSAIEITVELDIWGEVKRFYELPHTNP